MNTSAESTKTDGLSWSEPIAGLARHYLSGRRGLVVLAVAIVAAGLVLNWGWLVAVGVAPILLGLAPCTVMCALGLCMNKKGGKSCSSESNDKSAKAKSSSTPTGAKARAEA